MCIGCVSICYNDRGFIFIPHANTILADYGRVQFYLEKLILITKNTAFQTEIISYQDLLRKQTLRCPIGIKLCLMPSFHVPSLFPTWHFFFSPILWHVPKNGVNNHFYNILAPKIITNVHMVFVYYQYIVLINRNH